MSETNNLRLKQILLIIFCSFSLAKAQAQDWVADMRKMNKVYEDAGSFSMNVTVAIFNDEKSKSSLTSYTGKMAMSGCCYYSEMMNRITIVNKETRLLIDKSQQMILFRKNTAAAAKRAAAQLPMPGNLDSLMRATSKGSYLVNTSVEKRILVTNSNTQYGRMEIVIDPNTYTLKQIVLYNTTGIKDDPQKIIISYTAIQINGVNENVFSEKKYVSIGKTKVSATEAFKKYKLINEDNTITN